MTAPEFWGGIECTVNRVGNRYRDQVRLSGHHDRPEDLDLFASLGIAAIRYPVLWERTQIDGVPDWSWADERLGRLRRLGTRPIVGLVHHGSGPPHTHLLDDGFAPGLARHAGEVARRYDWVEEWTPVNEPVTTARFAALYGHWYPHKADPRSFWHALLNQIDATRLAMTAIRRVNPHARLIQTDDLGRTYATRSLAYQAEHDNLRRWAGWDLLFGRVAPHHPLFDMLDRMGFGERLRRIADDPCPPDVVGINHYLTSDRHLDHRLDRYPAHLHGRNGREAYADTEAVRVLDPAPRGLSNALEEAWARYRTPIAVTEVHNGSTREEQLRWAAQAWDGARDLIAKGVDIRAVTAWSLLGSRGWNTLLTDDGVYEPGLFDVSDGVPRPTALAALWRDLAQGAPRHPVADEPGWWQRPARLLYAAPRVGIAEAHAGRPRRPLVICGADGAMARHFAKACETRGIAYVPVGRHIEGDSDFQTIAATLRDMDAWGVVDASRSVTRAWAAARRPARDATRGDALAGRESTAIGKRGPPDRSGVRCCNWHGVEFRRGGPLPGAASTSECGSSAPDDDPVEVPDLAAFVDAAIDLLIDGATGTWWIGTGDGVTRGVATTPGDDGVLSCKILI